MNNNNKKRLHCLTFLLCTTNYYASTLKFLSYLRLWYTYPVHFVTCRPWLKGIHLKESGNETKNKRIIFIINSRTHQRSCLFEDHLNKGKGLLIQRAWHGVCHKWPVGNSVHILHQVMEQVAVRPDKEHSVELHTVYTRRCYAINPTYLHAKR